MDQEEIKKRNEAIALFMGRKIVFVPSTEWQGLGFWVVKGNYKTPYTASNESKEAAWEQHCEEARFNSSWSWLMPVVEKIEEDFKYEVSIYHKVCTIGKADYPEDTYTTIIGVDSTISSSKIESVFIAVSDYCLYYKTLKK